MIHEIGKELKARLVAYGCPIVTVVDGPEETTPTASARERIVIERTADPPATPVRGVHINPKHRMTRPCAAKVTIYAQAADSGAMPYEHRRRAEHVLDVVLVALDDVFRVRRNRWVDGGGSFVLPGDMAGTAKIGGAVYERALTFDRAIEVRTWAGAKRPELVMGVGGSKITSTTKVSTAHGPDNDSNPDNVPAAAETACGT